MTSHFHGARDFQVDRLKIVTNTVSSSSAVSPLKDLESYIAPEAIYDSAERCDAPKCHPETRIAVQGDLYGWIRHGDADNPSKMKWVTGPAGTGKTAIMGSLSERCDREGFLGASFFFSSTGSIGRRRKTAFVMTIAYQLAQHWQVLKDAIAEAIEESPIVFKKNLHVQMETLLLAPLRKVAGDPNGSELRGVIMVDGLDECEAEQYGLDSDSPKPRTQPILQRTRPVGNSASFA
ncbi:hypothetical protein EST38_g2098 [Candolleomyces aberdarensis]|uniref:Nephrocystin 3-like N-terminal domain-containing protein n=1 Tax=Candolleomyces aberdarensis TaxID=2316362 RepID=A0A4V1Q4Z0_9AGAR|nr:hypothetical protein EST38_g2098 [Candolleomyces aberdarensis]